MIFRTNPIKLAIILFALLCVDLSRSSLQAGDPIVTAMGDTFVSRLPSNWSSDRGDMKYFDAVGCYTSGPFCYGNNPSSPYGYLILPNRQRLSAVYQLKPNEAVVIFLRSPPPMRYFGFTQYLFSRHGSTFPLFASLSDTLNIGLFRSFNSSESGSDLFNQYAAIVWTADLNTFRIVSSIMHGQMIPEGRINFIPIPIELPLFMGRGLSYDTFTFLMRTAFPHNQAELDVYMAEKPFYVVKVGPTVSTPVSPAPSIGFASEISGVSEDRTLAIALNRLVSDIKANNSRFSFQEQFVLHGRVTGWDCIENDRICNGDNHDALYSANNSVIRFKNLNDVFIIAGVNHTAQRKALYVNHSIYDTDKSAGIMSIADPSLTPGSALYHAGVTSPDDPRIAEYDGLYAYAVSYDCGELQYCAEIPAPTPDNPLGLVPGSPFVVGSRAYVEPRTLVRPSQREIVTHRVLLGTGR